MHQPLEAETILCGGLQSHQASAKLSVSQAQPTWKSEDGRKRVMIRQGRWEGGYVGREWVLLRSSSYVGS